MKPIKIAKMFILCLLVVAQVSTSFVTAKADGTDVTPEEAVVSQENTQEDPAAGEDAQESSEDTEDKEEDTSKTTNNKTSKKKVSKKKVTKKKAKKVKAQKASYTAEELRLMASIIWCEARGESNPGKLAVGIVVMNRKKSSSFPNTIRGVIYQKNQFSPTRNGMMSSALSQYKAGKFEKTEEGRECIAAAKKALSGEKKISYKGGTKNLSGYYFFSRYISGARFKLGGHMFK